MVNARRLKLIYTRKAVHELHNLKKIKNTNVNSKYTSRFKSTEIRFFEQYLA